MTTEKILVWLPKESFQAFQGYCQARGVGWTRQLVALLDGWIKKEKQIDAEPTPKLPTAERRGQVMKKKKKHKSPFSYRRGNIY